MGLANALPTKGSKKRRRTPTTPRGRRRQACTPVHRPRDNISDSPLPGAMKFQALRGFRDYLPPDAASRVEVFRIVREAARRSGFEEVETPSVEALELLRAKSGAEIEAQTFAFRDKGDREVTLI